MSDEDAEFVLRQSELKTMFDMAVSSVMTSIDNHIIFALESSTAGSRAPSIGNTVRAAIVTIMDEQVGENAMFQMVSDAVDHAVIIQNVVSPVAHNHFGCDELMAPIAMFSAKNVKEKADKDENVNEKEDKWSQSTATSAFIGSVRFRFSREKIVSRKKAVKVFPIFSI